MRLGRLICGDIHFQWKYGFYFIYFILTVLYVCGIAALPEHWKTDIASIMIYSDPAAMGLFFMGAIVLLEKSQKVLNAMVVSPVKISEYTFKNSCVDCYFYGNCIDIRVSFRQQSFAWYRSWYCFDISNLYYAWNYCSYKDFKLEPVSYCNYADRNCLLCSTYCWSVCDFTRCVLLFSVHGLYEPYNWKKYVTIVRYGNCNCYVEYPLHNCKGYS